MASAHRARKDKQAISYVISYVTISHATSYCFVVIWVLLHGTYPVISILILSYPYIRISRLDKYKDMKGYLSVTYPPILSSHILFASQAPYQCLSFDILWYPYLSIHNHSFIRCNPAVYPYLSFYILLVYPNVSFAILFTYPCLSFQILPVYPHLFTCLSSISMLLSVSILSDPCCLSVLPFHIRPVSPFASFHILLHIWSGIAGSPVPGPAHH